MLIRNLGDGLVNGSIGTVQNIVVNEHNVVTKLMIKFNDPESGSLLQDPNYDNAVGLPKLDQEFLYNGRFIVRRQFPIVPAWSVSIHKSQGMTLDSVRVGIQKKIFSHGMIYVALSRVRTLDGLYLENGYNFDTKWYTPHSEVAQWNLDAREKFSGLKKELKTIQLDATKLF